VCSRACTLSQYRTKLLLLSHNFSNVMINNTSTDEAHYSEMQGLAPIYWQLVLMIVEELGRSVF
jgi:hypothetical protein